MKKLIATMLSVVVLTWAGIGCEGNPTGSGDSMPSPSSDPAAGDDGGGEGAKPSADKAAKGSESGEKKGG
jgi:hypothetical protein